MTIRNNLIGLLNQYAAGCHQLLNQDSAANLSPAVYTLAEPRVGHDDFVTFYNTHVNVCYRIVNVWDVVPHLPPDIAEYEHEDSELTIDSGFSLDVVHNHVLATGYACGITRWNNDHRRKPPNISAPSQYRLVGQTM
jgi:lipase (class 3)